jgi:hypothetical protein
LVTFFKFGPAQRTKLNQKPFIIMFWGLCFTSFELILLLSNQANIMSFVATFTLEGFRNCTSFKEFFWFNNFVWVIHSLKIFCLDIFVVFFCYELFTLLRFVVV